MTRFEKVVNTVVVIAVAWLAGTVGMRQLDSRARSERTPPKPEFVAEWRSLLSIGITRGHVAAPIHVVTFMDLECPFCRRFHQDLEGILESDSMQIAATFVHYPLRMHRFAMPAALAAECAREQNGFNAFVAQVLRGQDSLGLKSWVAFATQAQVADTLRFVRCIAEKKTAPEISQGIEAGERIGVRGTPTVIINGWKLVGTPTAAELERIMRAVARGEEPFARPVT